MDGVNADFAGAKIGLTPLCVPKQMPKFDAMEKKMFFRSKEEAPHPNRLINGHRAINIV